MNRKTYLGLKTQTCLESLSISLGTTLVVTICIHSLSNCKKMLVQYLKNKNKNTGDFADVDDVERCRAMAVVVAMYNL